MRLLLLAKASAREAASCTPLLKARDVSSEYRYSLIRKEITDKNGHRTTVYVKPETPAPEGGQSAQAPSITGVVPLAVTSQHYGEIAKREFEKLRKKIRSGLYCQALGNRQVVGTKAKHLKSTKGKRRTESEILQRVTLMPYIVPIIEIGKHTETRNDKHGSSYKITGRVNNNGVDKNISVIWR